MKNKAVILILSLFFLGASCSTEDNEIPGEANQEKDLIEVNFKIGGEFTLSEIPLKSAEMKDSDLFGIQFYDLEQNKPYAFVVGNDISQVSVDLKKNKPYKVVMTYIKDGKNIIHLWQEKQWGAPFRAREVETEMNVVYYSPVSYLDALSSAEIWAENEELSPGRYVEVDRYHGVLEKFQATKEEETVVLDLKRMVFGVNLDIHLEETDVDLLRFSVNYKTHHYQEYFVPLENGQGSLEIPYLTLGFPNHPYYGDNHLDHGVVDHYTEDVHISLGTAENHIQFFDGKINVGRNVMMNIDYKPGGGGETSEDDIYLGLEDGELEEEEVVLPSND